jgi:periplasmic copper chaperone A
LRERFRLEIESYRMLMNSRWFPCWALLLGFMYTVGASAAESVKVMNGWLRAPAPGQKTAAAYIELMSDHNAAIVAAGSPAAARVEMHSTTTEGGVMRMRALSRIELPAGQAVKLAAGGTHFMLVDLKQALKPGDKVPLVISVQPTGPSAGSALTTVNVELDVRAGASSSHQH